jgi:hypothetical protein
MSYPTDSSLTLSASDLELLAAGDEDVWALVLYEQGWEGPDVDRLAFERWYWNMRQPEELPFPWSDDA